MSDLSPAAQALATQGRICAAMGAPFSGALLAHASADQQADGPLRALMAPWREVDLETHFKLATPLRWLGAAHDLALSGDDLALTGAYPHPTQGGDETLAWAALQEAMTREAGRFSAFMGHEPQTNEVRRSTCLIGGFLRVAEVTGLPLRVFELGASAGLNQNFDRFRYDLGAAGAWGATHARVKLDTDWRGPPPALGAPLKVVERSACDRAPIALNDEASRRRLRAYVWADQAERLERLDAAVAQAIQTPAPVETCDAAAFLKARVRLQRGTASVIFHSVFWQYLPPESQAALEGAIRDLGHDAGPAAPLAWLRMEPSAQSLAEMEVRLTLWPAGEETRLARCHAHGAWVEWAPET